MLAEESRSLHSASDVGRLAPALPPRWRKAHWEKLAGDASTRRYFRLRLNGGETSVAALYPPDSGDSLRRFVQDTAILRRSGLPVPQLHAVRETEGLVLQEDLGDMLLQRFVRERGLRAALPLYESALDMLAVFRDRASRGLPKGSFAAREALDEALFRRELEMTRRCLLEGLWRRRSSPALRRELAAIARRAAAQPRVLCHRDWHSRNLLVRWRTVDYGRLLPEGGFPLPGQRGLRPALAVVDYQDMRMGPWTYDLASLLYDSYAALPVSMRARLAARFLEDARERFHERDFHADLRAAALQRNLKALGTFAFQGTARAKRVYLKYIPRTLGYVREHLAALPGEYPALEMSLRRGRR